MIDKANIDLNEGDKVVVTKKGPDNGHIGEVEFGGVSPKTGTIVYILRNQKLCQEYFFERHELKLLELGGLYEDKHTR